MKIVYLHGFASSGVSTKVDKLKEAFGSDNVIAPNLPFEPSEALDILDEIIRSIGSYPIILVGTSLGGFYGLYLSAKYDIPCVIVNPSMTPSVTIGNRLGETITNYHTGDSFTITKTSIEMFKAMENFITKEQDSVNIHLILAKDDEVLDYVHALKHIPYRRHLTLSEDGGHRFDAKWDIVIKEITNIKGLLAVVANQQPTLLNCPFCNTKLSIDDSDTVYPTGGYWGFTDGIKHYVSRRDVKPGFQACYQVICNEIYGGCSAAVTGDSKEEAINKWNTRHKQ